MGISTGIKTGPKEPTMEDNRSISSSIDSSEFDNFQSQTELCPSHIISSKTEKSSAENHDNFGYVEDVDKQVEISAGSDVEKSSKSEKEVVGVRRYGGMLLTLAASLLFSLVVLFVKMLKEYKFDAYGASFWRYAGVTVPAIPLLMFYECGPGNKNRGTPTPNASIFDTVWPVFKDDNWKTCLGLLSRGLIGSSSVILRYYALQYLSIGDTSVITYSTPVLVTVMAHFILREKCGVVPIIIAFTTLAGVIIVTKPPLLTGADSFDTDTLIGTGLACGSLFCSSLIVILTRMIREVHFSLMTLVFGVIGLVQAAVLSQTLGTFNVPIGLNDSLLVAGVAVLSFLGQMAIILALKFEQAGPVALIRSCDVIFGFVLQFLVLNVVPDKYSSIGAVIVLVGVIVTAWRKYLVTLPEGSPQRSKWSWVMK